MDPQAELLLRKAGEDRATLEFDLPEAIFGFHAQQAYEKLLKALIAARNIRFDRTHDLEKLIAQVEAIGEGPLPLPTDFPMLQSYAVFLRYDDPEPEQVIDRARVRADIDTLAAFVTARLQKP
jgi:hypothetical protein